MIAVILDGGPFDGRDHELAAPVRFIEVKRICHEHPEHNVVARYYPTDEMDLAGRQVMRYEAP